MNLDIIKKYLKTGFETSERLLKWFFLYISIIGLFGFSLFILEESVQLVTFSNFACKDANRYDLIKKNNHKIEQILGHMRVINTYLMWMQPFQWVAYDDYINATESYVEAMQGLVLANDPGLYQDEEISIDFYYRTASQSTPGVWELRAGRLVEFRSELPDRNPIRLSGRVVSIKPNLWGVEKS